MLLKLPRFVAPGATGRFSSLLGWCSLGCNARSAGNGNGLGQCGVVNINANALLYSAD